MATEEFDTRSAVELDATLESDTALETVMMVTLDST
jgi:hypothetical protein